MNKQTIITLLIAPDGTILARGLRGEDIEKKLTEVFSNKKKE